MESGLQSIVDMLIEEYQKVTSSTGIISKHVLTSRYRMCSIKKDVLKKFCKIQRERPVPQSFDLHMCFPVNFVKFLRIPFSQNTSGRLLLP